MTVSILGPTLGSWWHASMSLHMEKPPTFTRNLALISSLIHRSLTHYGRKGGTFLPFLRYWRILYQNRKDTGAWMKAIKLFAMSSIFIVLSGSRRNRGDTQSGNQNHLATVAWMRAWNALPSHLSSLSLLATRETAVEGTPHPETRDTQHWTLSQSLKESHPICVLVPICHTVPGTGIS